MSLSFLISFNSKSFTFREVDFQARHRLKTKQKEFQDHEINRVITNEDQRVISVLKMGNSTINQLWGDTMDRLMFG
jgi:hypothetical protein